MLRNRFWSKKKQETAGSRILIFMAVSALVWGSAAGLTGCVGKDTGESGSLSRQEMPKVLGGQGRGEPNTAEVINFDQRLDSYEPLKTHYHFYFTYKTVHPWWDAVGLGMEDAAKQYEERGIVIDYEYLAPDSVSAKDQTEKLLEASRRDFDVIGVDVADVTAVTPVINELIADGHKVMTFSSSDASKEDGCQRIAYVGNTHNYEDGAQLTETLCERLGYRGNVALLVGSQGVPCHEDRARGARDVIEKYPDMEIVETAYDGDDAGKAQELAKEFLTRHQDLAGIICCNMSNPVGAARAVVEAGRQKEVAIVGMDHDQEALRYLKEGVIYALGIQDCYSIGFDTIQVAMKIADGCLPGELYPEKTEEITTIIYQDGAPTMLQALYGEID